MASFRSICIILVIISVLINISYGLYEDQIGKFDWKKSYVGKVKHANFDSKRVIVATEENVLASLNLKTGEIIWRQLLEDPAEQQIQMLHVADELVTVSGGQNSWFIRLWDMNLGTLISEWTLYVEKPVDSEWLVSKDKLIHIVPAVGSHLEITTYDVQTGQNSGKTTRISAPWISTDCALSKSTYTCIFSTSGNVVNLRYIDVLSDEGEKTLIKNIPQLSPVATLKPIAFNAKIPAYLLSAGSVASLIYLDDSDTTILANLMSNAIGVLNDGKNLLFQLEANVDNPEKLIIIKAKNLDSGLEEMLVELAYPLGLGAPYIVSGQCKGTICDLLLCSTDNAIVLVRLPEGKILWTREEAISNIVATEFLELPVSELDASIEKEFKSSSGGIGTMLMHRLSTQAKQLYNLLFGGQLLANSPLVRDEFGLHKIIVVATEVGKLFGIDTITGSIVWSYRLPNIKSFQTINTSKMVLFVQRTARYAPWPAQCTLLAEDASNGLGIMFQFDPITGSSFKGIERLDYPIKQAMLLPYEDKYNVKPFIVYSDNNRVFVHPEAAKTLVQDHISTMYFYTVDSSEGTVKGFSLQTYGLEFKATHIWNVDFGPSKVIAISAKPANERVHSQGRVLPDRSVYYKYVNPNLLAIATLTVDPIHKHVLSVYLLDGVNGLVLYSNSHKKARGPIHLVHSENWLVYSFYSERFRRTEVVAAELYEGLAQSNSTVFSSHAVSLLPHVQCQSYVLPATPTTMSVTMTERGITNKFLLMALNNGAIAEIPWMLLQPRFANIVCGPEESCIPYMPEIPMPPEATINYNQTLGRVRGIEVAPARLESTSHVLAHGLDLFYTRVAPSKSFDVLKEDFDYNLILFVLTGLIVASYITKHFASQKALKQVWK